MCQTLNLKWEEILKTKEVAARDLERMPSKTKRAMRRYKIKNGEIVVYFDERGEGKARIMVEATKLPKEKLVESEREFWKGILDEYF